MYDGLVSGVHHALNNRLASVSALAQLLSLGDAPGPGMEGALLEEIRRFEETLRLLRLLPGDPADAPVPLLLPDLLPDASALFALHREVQGVRLEVEGDPEVLPIVAGERAAMRALLVLLVALGRDARRSGSGVVRLGWSGDERFVLLTGVVDGRRDEGAEVDGLEELFAPAAGEVQGVPGGYRVRMPTLPEVRRRERG